MAGRTDLEQLVYQMSTDIRALERQNRRALANVDGTANKIEARYKALGRADVGKFLDQTFDRSRLAVFEAGAARIPIFGGALEALGPAGFAAAAGLGAAALGATQAVAAMRFADEIDDTAQSLAIGTDALQEYRFAMTEVGGETSDAEKAIESFQRKFGEAQSGLSARAMKPFAALGFTQEELKTYQSFEEILPEIADRVAALGKESERAAVVEKLGLGPMLPLLREGAARMEELRQKAQDIGYVMDAELVRKGAEANQEFETMARIIDVQLKSSFVGLSDEVLAFTGVIAGALNRLNDFLELAGRLKARANAMYGDDFVEEVVNGNAGQALVSAVRSVASGRTTRAAALIRAGGDLGTGDPVDRDALAALAFGSAPSSGTDLLDTSTSTGSRARGPSGPSAEDIARRRAELERTLAIEIARLSNNEALVRALEREAAIGRRAEQYESLKLSSAEALALATADQLRIDEAQNRAHERALVVMQDQAELERLKVQGNEASAQALEDRLALARTIEALEKNGLTLAQATEVATLNQLDLQRARAQVQARIIADAALERQIQLAQIEGDEVRLRALERAAEISRRAREIEGRERLNFGEGEGRASSEVDEEIAAASRRGFRDGVRGMLDDLQDGSLEGVLSGIFDRVSDRLKDNLADMLTDFLMRSASGGAGGGWESKVANAALSLFGRRERGGSGRAGVPIIVGEKRPEVFVPGVNGTVLPSVSALGRGGGVQRASRTSIDFRQTIDLRGANGDAQIRSIAYQAAAEGAEAAYQRARADIPGEMAMVRKYSR